MYPGMISEWKNKAFMGLWNIEGLLDKEAVTNLIVLGDSQYEMEAGSFFQKMSRNCIIKKVKLI